MSEKDLIKYADADILPPFRIDKAKKVEVLEIEEVPHEELNMKNINAILDEVKDYFEEQLFENEQEGEKNGK